MLQSLENLPLSKCLYKLDPLFALVTLNKFAYFMVWLIFWGPLDVFFEFHLFSGRLTASLGKLATTVLIIPCGICLPTAAFMDFLEVFPAGYTFGLCCFFSFSSMSLKLALLALRKLMKVLWCCVMRSHVMDRTIGKWTEPNAYFVRQSVLIAMLELGRPMSGEL